MRNGNLVCHSFLIAAIRRAALHIDLPEGVFPHLGQSGHWGAASPTAAISRSTVVALGLGSNDRSALQATSGIDSLRPVRLFTSRAASLRQPPLTLLGGCVTRHLATFESPAHRCLRPQVYEKPSRCRLPDLK